MPVNGVNNNNNSYRDYMSNWVTNEANGKNEDGSDTTVNKTGATIDAVISDEKERGVTVQDFLQLMVAQLKNQDFMNPVDDTQYVTQLAQFATMQQMQELAEHSKANYVSSLVGKNVTVAKMSVSGNVSKVEGPIEKITLFNNEYKVYVDGQAYDLSEIMILNDPSSQQNKYSQATYASALVGKTVSATSKNEEGIAETVEGVVDKMAYVDGEYKVYVNDKAYSLDDVAVINKNTSGDDSTINNGNGSNNGNNSDDSTDPPPEENPEAASYNLNSRSVNNSTPTQAQYEDWIYNGTQWW